MGCHSSSSFLIILITLNYLCPGLSNEKSNSSFKPTNEWQKTEEGQSIPRGLHVKINLQTGYKEAKLHEDKYQKNGVKSLITTEKKENHDDESLDANDLKRMLKNIKSDEVSGENYGNEEKKFRSYEDLKKHFSDLNVQVKTDSEIISNLVENFKKFNVIQSRNLKNEDTNEIDDSEILSSLVDLEYLVHQYDNAKEFARMNGFSEVIHRSLNSSNSEIRSEALRLHGSATQSNPKVQIAALDSGTINVLLKILKFDEDINVRSRSLYALSCLLRRFPAAQQKLITDGGLTVFANAFDEEKEESLRIQIKIITLIHDLLFERKDTKINILEEENLNETNSKLQDLKEKLRQYQKIDIENKLVEQNWCLRISNWFIKQNFINKLYNLKSTDATSEYSVVENHDLIEKTVDTLYALSDICQTKFQSETELLKLLLKLKDIYSKLSSSELNNKDDNSSHFYAGLSNILDILIHKMKGKIITKEEL